MKLDLTYKKALSIFASAFKSREMVLKTKQRVKETKLHCHRKKTGDAVLRNTKERPCSHCCRGKEMSITQHECVDL